MEYSPQSNWQSVHKVSASCIQRCLVSCACDRVMSVLSAALPVLIFTFHFHLLFVHNGRQTALQRVVLIHNIGHWTLSKIRGGAFLVQNVQSQGNDFKLI